jgi:hypothetical protein
MIGIELSLTGTYSPRIIWGLFFVQHYIHLSLYWDAGERVLKEIDFRIRSTVVFFLKYLENRKSTLTILSVYPLFLPTATISRSEHVSPTLLTHVLVHASHLCSLCTVVIFIYYVAKTGLLLVGLERRVFERHWFSIFHLALCSGVKLGIWVLALRDGIPKSIDLRCWELGSNSICFLK